MGQAVSRRPFKAKALVQSQANASEVCYTQSGAGTRFFSQYLDVCLSVSFRQCSTLVQSSANDAGSRLRYGGLIAGRARSLYCLQSVRTCQCEKLPPIPWYSTRGKAAGAGSMSSTRTYIRAE